nr:hypothetical protein [Cutibacterium modestum]
MRRWHAGCWVSKFNSNAKVYSDVFDGVDVPEWFDAVEDDYDGQPASVTLALPPYSAVIVSRA